MIAMIEVLVVITVLSLLMAQRASRYLWTGVLAVLLLLWPALHDPPAWALFTAWAIFLPAALLLVFTPLRQQLVTGPLLTLPVGQ